MQAEPLSDVKSKEKPSGSSLERLFLTEWEKCPLRGVKLLREVRFHPERKFRFDFAVPSCRVAVELDGFGGGHQNPWSQHKDHEKNNLAIENGWVILRHNSRSLGSKEKRREAIAQLRRILISRIKEIQQCQ